MTCFHRNMPKMGFDTREAEADYFAANLLMPTKEVRKLLRCNYLVGEIAQYFCVPLSEAYARVSYLKSE